MKERCNTVSGKPISHCKYGFPKPISREVKVDCQNLRTNLIRRTKEDQRTVGFKLESAILFQAHVNDELINKNAWIAYLCKYIPKAAKMYKVLDKSQTSGDVEYFLRTRVVGRLEAGG